MCADSADLGMVSKWVQQKIMIQFLKITGLRLIHGRTLSALSVRTSDGRDFAELFTLDGTFECGLIARHP